MKSTVLKSLLVGILSLGLCTGITYAAQREKPGDPDKDAGKTVTITGCLEKGNEAGEYSIQDASGKMYELQSTSVKLDDHLNHKVTVTGEMVQTDKEKQKEEGGHQHVNVTNLKMVSMSCQ